ncbi:uncharacterized protein BO80DRAFT_150282 [Aspergillus ibericus CBS 121593]|uniref:Uncharacterized protein n=1 Tax=Aspergillus ibericus CBS 121593 TaxID=1448316 RepID=A0A395GVB0_9EURO|nr:hypothetical protein BO80DRAFT_150282 [Aspergillus ibericus CBS 121593]RAK98948.1 hypothetical protein BO80DRAFT_150282 [Aspergillus ibericus CBS 121593]
MAGVERCGIQHPHIYLQPMGFRPCKTREATISTGNGRGGWTVSSSRMTSLPASLHELRRGQRYSGAVTWGCTGHRGEPGMEACFIPHPVPRPALEIEHVGGVPLHSRAVPDNLPSIVVRLSARGSIANQWAPFSRSGLMCTSALSREIGKCLFIQGPQKTPRHQGLSCQPKTKAVGTKHPCHQNFFLSHFRPNIGKKVKDPRNCVQEG